MIEAFVYITGILVAAIIIFMVLFFVREEHPALRFFLVMLLLTLALLAPKTAWDARQDCEAVVQNSTEINASVTRYDYVQFCHTTQTNTPGTFYTIMMWSFYGIIGYVIVYVMISALNDLKNMRFK